VSKKTMMNTGKWKDLFEFYYRSAADCYANEKAEPESSDKFPGAKIMTRTEGKFGYHDIWNVGALGDYGVSGGQTVLTVDQIPVWMLQYWGWYDKRDDRVLEVLKEALLAGYASKTSKNGRGPEKHTSQDDNYVYSQSSSRIKRAFSLPTFIDFKCGYEVERLLDFQGEEKIVRKVGQKHIDWAERVFNHSLVGYALVM